MLTIETGVDVPDAALRIRAQQSAPRLRAAFRAGNVTPGRMAVERIAGRVEIDIVGQYDGLATTIHTLRIQRDTRA